ncbi:MAG: HD domain-containing protein [Deltaproteobacteria bacterium]|nr:HD domain-containing protein [Deltaproteobacteria bacterium]
MTKEKAQTRKKPSDMSPQDFIGVGEQIRVDPLIQQVAEAFRQQEAPLCLVGGAIRDIILKRDIKDYDFVVKEMTPAFLDHLGALLEASVFPMGKGRQEQVYRLVKGKRTIDFAVMAGDAIDQDLMRRDFTINAIAYSFAEGRFFADSQAIKDVREGRIAPVSPQALQADPLRMLRAVRYRCTLPGFDLTAQLKEEITRHRGLVSDVAQERIRAELDAINFSPDPAGGLQLMHELGLLITIFPELAPLEGLPQGRHHHTDALSHTIEVVGEVNRLMNEGPPFAFRSTDQDRLILGYAALFHDLGKPATKSIDEGGEVHFYGHPQESSLLSQGIMRRLKFPNRVRDGVLLVVENHMRILTLARGEPKDNALRRLINTMGEEIRLLLLLGLAETGSKGNGDDDEQVRFMDLSRRIWDLYEREDLIAPEPLLRGRDLLGLGHEPDPRMGEILEEVRKRQIAGELRNKEEALQFVRKEYAL